MQTFITRAARLSCRLSLPLLCLLSLPLLCCSCFYQLHLLLFISFLLHLRVPACCLFLPRFRFSVLSCFFVLHATKFFIFSRIRLFLFPFFPNAFVTSPPLCITLQLPPPAYTSFSFSLLPVLFLFVLFILLLVFLLLFLHFLNVYLFFPRLFPRLFSFPCFSSSFFFLLYHEYLLFLFPRLLSRLFPFPSSHSHSPFLPPSPPTSNIRAC